MGTRAEASLTRRINLNNLKELSWYALSSVIARSANFWTLPIYTRVFSAEIWGTIQLVYVISTLVQVVFLPGLEGIYFKYGFKFGEKNAVERTNDLGFLFRTHLVLVTLYLPILAMAFVFLMGRLFPSVPSSFILLALIGLGASSFRSPYLVWLRMQRNASKATLIESLIPLISISFSLTGIFFFRWGALSLFLGECVASLLIVPFLLPFFRSIWHTPVSQKNTPELLRGIFTVVPQTILRWIYNSADRFILGYVLGTAAVGTFVATAQIANLLMAVGIIFNKQWRIFIFKTQSISQKLHIETTSELYRRAQSLFLAGAAIMALASPLAVEILLGKSFRHLAMILPALALANVFKISGLIVSLVCWANTQKRLLIKIDATVSLSFLLLSLAFIHFWGVNGLTYAYLLGFFLYPLIIQLHPKLTPLHIKLAPFLLSPHTLLSVLCFFAAFVGCPWELRILLLIVTSLNAAFLLKQYLSFIRKLPSK